MYNNCIADYIMVFLSNNLIIIVPKLEKNKTNLEDTKVNLSVQIYLLTVWIEEN